MKNVVHAVKVRDLTLQAEIDIAGHAYRVAEIHSAGGIYILRIETEFLEVLRGEDSVLVREPNHG